MIIGCGIEVENLVTLMKNFSRSLHSQDLANAENAVAFLALHLFLPESVDSRLFLFLLPNECFKFVQKGGRGKLNLSLFLFLSLSRVVSTDYGQKNRNRETVRENLEQVNHCFSCFCANALRHTCC